MISITVFNIFDLIGVSISIGKSIKFQNTCNYYWTKIIARSLRITLLQSFEEAKIGESAQEMNTTYEKTFWIQTPLSLITYYYLLPNNPQSAMMVS